VGPNVAEGHNKASGLDLIQPQATLTYGQCALGLAQFKAVGLAEVFDLTTAHSPQSFSAEPT